MSEILLRGRKNLTIEKLEAVNNRRRHDENAFLADLPNTVGLQMQNCIHAETPPTYLNRELGKAFSTCARFLVVEL